MNVNRLGMVLKGAAVVMGIIIMVLNFSGLLTSAAGVAWLSIVLAALCGLTIGSMLRN